MGSIAILGAAAFLTAVLSAIVGMAGGITLLAVMLLFLEPLAAIPLHGAIQLVSNASRTAIQRSHVAWPIVGRFAFLLVPAGMAGLSIAQALPAPASRALIGAFVLVATWSPRLLLLGTHPERTNPRRRFVLLGGVAGALNVTVGATGPLIAPFFLNVGLSRQGLVGTKAACQTLGHLVKIVLFGAVGFAFGPHLPLLGVAAFCVLSGTWIGSLLLERLSERTFTLLYRLVLTLIALRLVGGELWSLLAAT